MEREGERETLISAQMAMVSYRDVVGQSQNRDAPPHKLASLRHVGSKIGLEIGPQKRIISFEQPENFGY